MTNLWQETPLLYSTKLSEVLGSSVYLKLENLHPSYSFKYRGISHFVKKAKDQHGPSIHAIIASGGNAGLAAACASRALEVKCTVFIPQGVSQTTLDMLRREKAEVVIIGRHYAEALIAAKDMVNHQPDAVMIPAYEDPIIWEGHSSIVTELSNQLPKKPDAIFCSVGGGGLLGGIIVGCSKVGWEDVPLVALETIGSDCFYHSIALNNGRFNSAEKQLPEGVDLVHDKAHDIFLAHFSSFSSKASGSLGASQPAAAVVDMALKRKGGVQSISVPDILSMQALVAFANDHKFLVELACSTSLVPAYNLPLFDKLVPSKGHNERRVVVFVICGGFKISVAEAAEYQTQVGEEMNGGVESWQVKCNDGELFRVEKRVDIAAT